MYSRTALQSYLLEDLPAVESFLTSDMTPQAARIFSLKTSLLKKFVDDSDQKACDTAALEKFLECNRLCQDFKLEPKRLYDDVIIGEVKSLLIDAVGNGPSQNLDVWSFSDHLSLGPGANVGAKSYNFYTKLFDSNLTKTDDHLLRLYRTIVSRNPTWYYAEKARHQVHGSKTVAGSQLNFVAKTSQISRTICTEPTLNMLFQKALGKLIEGMLKRSYNITLDKQPDINRRMAKMGSIEGNFATIDLESASDSISMQLCESVMPRQLLSWLKLFRSPVTTLPGGQQVKLEMVSSMGNGFTFPLQTLLFASIVVACYRLKGLTPFDGRTKEMRNFSVFGDDIIVRNDCYDLVVHALSLFGFRINRLKSFNSGHFRESCGEDYYRGHNIRGVYLESLASPCDIYSAVNRLVRWSAKSGILLRSLVGALRRKVKYLPIPYCDGDAEGFKVPYSMTEGRLRWNKDFQCPSYQAMVPKPVSISLPQPENDYAEVGLAHNLFYRKKVIRRARWYAESDPFGYNPDGLYIAAVGGFIRDGRITFRSEEGVQTTLVRRCCSSWNFIPKSEGNLYPNSGSWEATALELLSL